MRRRGAARKRSASKAGRAFRSSLPRVPRLGLRSAKRPAVDGLTCSSMVEHWTDNPSEKVRILHKAEVARPHRGAGREPALYSAGWTRWPAMDAAPRPSLEALPQRSCVRASGARNGAAPARAR
jgi:hypothetical protein